MKLSFYGADRCVTGSCHCLEVNGKKILIDCGLQQGRDEIDNHTLPFQPGLIDYVLVTHAHIDHSGRIPLLIKQGFRGSILTITPENVDEVYTVNFRNYMLCAGAAARHMVADKIEGNIIFITSSRAEMAYPDDYLYGGFKACVKRATESMALDLSSYNIRVNCVAPGATWTPKNPAMLSPFVKESIPLHRVGTPRENGEVVAFLASENASYITGITVRVDGGLILPGMLEGYDKIPWVREDWKKDQYEKAMAMVKKDEE